MSHPPSTSDATVTDARYCRGCRYPLNEVREHRCPECGRAFDPGYPRTWREDQDRFTFGWLAAVVGIWLVLITAPIGIAGLVADLTPFRRVAITACLCLPAITTIVVAIRRRGAGAAACGISLAACMASIQFIGEGHDFEVPGVLVLGLVAAGSAAMAMWLRRDNRVSRDALMFVTVAFSLVTIPPGAFFAARSVMIERELPRIETWIRDSTIANGRPPSSLAEYPWIHPTNRNRIFWISIGPDGPWSLRFSLGTRSIWTAMDFRGSRQFYD